MTIAQHDAGRLSPRRFASAWSNTGPSITLREKLSLARRTLRAARAAMLTVFLVGMHAAPGGAHETDQYTLPVGREFADLGPYFSRMVHRAVEDAVADTNARIQRALNARPSARQTGELQSSDFIAGKVWLHLFRAFPTIESLDGSLASEKMRAGYPGLITAYRPELAIYDDPLLMLDITKVVRTFFRAWALTLNPAA
jgi:hypothetical protein